MTEALTFKGFVEVVPAVEVRRDYNVLSGELAEEVLKRANACFGKEFKGFPGLEGTLQFRGQELTGSNLPVLATMNLVNLKELGIQLCDEQDLARVYNDEVQRLAQGKQGFFHNKFWFDVALIRNPYARQKDLKPWEEQLDREITYICGADAIVSVPYRAILPVVLSSDNAPFGQIVGYSFRINPTMTNVVKPVEVTASEAQNGYDFAGLDKANAFPVKGQGRHFHGISSDRRLSRLYVSWYLNANYNGNPLNSSVGCRVVVKSAEGTAQK